MTSHKKQFCSIRWGYQITVLCIDRGPVSLAKCVQLSPTVYLTFLDVSVPLCVRLVAAESEF